MAFIVFEGIDGSGKSTLIRGLCEHLDQRQLCYITTREPGGTPLAEEIRSLLLRHGEEVPHPRTELLLYQASRAQHVEQVIRPALQENKWVLCDRYTSSSLAFQAGGRSIEESDIKWLNDFATGELYPSVWVLLDLPVEESIRRRQVRTESGGDAADRFEVEKRDFHNKVRDHYLKQVEEQPEHWIVIDAQLPPTDVLKALLTKLEQKGILKSN